MLCLPFSVCSKSTVRTRCRCPPCSHYAEGGLVVSRIFAVWRSRIEHTASDTAEIEKASNVVLAFFGLLQINRPYPLPLSALFALRRGRFSCEQNFRCMAKPYRAYGKRYSGNRKGKQCCACLFGLLQINRPYLKRQGRARAISPRYPSPQTVPFSHPA